MADDKKCWVCKRTLVGETKFGLCPECLNKYGSPATAVAALGVGFGIKQLLKKSKIIIKFASKKIKS